MARKKVRNKTGNKKAAAERLIKDLQKQAKDVSEEPKGLDELIKSIQKEEKVKEEKEKRVSALVKSITEKQKEEDKTPVEDIDERILELLGIEDYEAELDYDAYTVLLKEYLTKQNISGKGIEKEGDTELLKKELKRARGEKGKFKPKSKKKKVTASGFVGRKTKTPTTNKPKKISTDRLLPSSGQTSSPENIKTEIQEDTQEKLIPLSRTLSEIEDNLQKILELNKKKLELDKQAQRDQDKKEETAGFKETEARLEEKDGKQFKEKAEKKLKPVSNIFDMILNFFKNILLGGAISLLLDIITNPAKYMRGLIDFLNYMIDFANNIIQSVSQFIFAPFNAVITAINDAFNELEWALKQLANIIPGVPTPKFPDIPLLALPLIPPINYPQWAQQQAGGGEVINVNNLSLFDGGAIDSKSGMRISGMGKDTQLIAAQPGEIMFSKKAVDMFGAENLLAANAMAGGSNKPKYGKIPGFQSGGQVGKVIIGAGHAPTPANAARGIGLGSDNRSVQGTADDGSSGGNANPTGVKEWEATRHVVGALKTLVEQRGLTDKIGFRDIYSWSGLRQVPQEVESVRGQQYVDLHFDARGYGRAGVLPSANESATDRSLMKEFGRYSSSFDPNSKGVTRGGGTLLELARIDDPAIRGLLEEVKRGEQGPNTLRMAEKILRGIVPSVGVSPAQVDDLSGAPPAPILPPPPGAQLGRTNIEVTQISPPVTRSGGGTAVLPVPTGGQSPTSAASPAQGRVPGFSAEDGGNFDMLVVKSIYNIVG